ncbi:mitochondrial import inner membrane translocase subunit tim10, putative [Theileria equi strain WA]|uniref:Mitochondrial import inner membrane translocase subunit n=1 Tax=Theileria equi strain WA TaxID=1537102 RepID=L1LFH3_THEEQ|nr:mitochondrial import inner membrane translocase subunit tim10, putative [Theileria equi strain WA]EKX74024.1 mitochondrial import inner membrane translocase subunit tim10, putative [Theileria equi strain WA]|eukprot:XP_004833476.1 mitochondrial import inner membrane translocase subunit tim10, putative [Theileria equi strain WA]
MSENLPTDPVNVAVAELVGMADMLRRMRDGCWNKCISSVKGPQLDAGESSCIDRCVNKYLDIHTLVGFQLQQASQNAEQA